MYYYRVDFSREALQRDPEEPEGLLQELRRILASMPPILPGWVRYRKMSGAHGSRVLWFAFERPEVDRLLVTIDSLKPYAWTPVQRPAWPDPEWTRIGA